MRSRALAAVLLAAAVLAGPGTTAAQASAPPPSYASQMKPDPVNSSMTPAQRVIWAKAALADLEVPVTAANVQTMVDWFANEGTPHDYDNPLNLQTYYGHSYDQDVTGDPVLQAYPVPQDFPHAFGREMRHGGPDAGSAYVYIIRALRSGKGMIGNRTRGVEQDLLIYSGGGYDTIPAWYCPC